MKPIGKPTQLTPGESLVINDIPRDAYGLLISAEGHITDGIQHRDLDGSVLMFPIDHQQKTITIYPRGNEQTITYQFVKFK